ncbi:MAG: YezD family protein [Planctomycetaceae bacterium]|nr:YezD family protein [Planctomycetaceae bacterium]
MNGIHSTEGRLSTHHDALDDASAEDLAEIRNALRGIRFGSLHVIVQDGVVVQIDRTERHRTRRREKADRSALPPSDD